MRLSEAENEGVFDCTLRLKSLSKAAEDLLVFLTVFLRKNYKARRSKVVLRAVYPAALFALGSFRARRGHHCCGLLCAGVLKAWVLHKKFEERAPYREMRRTLLRCDLLT